MGGGAIGGSKVPNAKPAGHPYHYAYQPQYKRDDKPSEKEKQGNTENEVLKLKPESNHKKPSSESTENEAENGPESTGTTPTPLQKPNPPIGSKEGKAPEGGVATGGGAAGGGAAGGGVWGLGGAAGGITGGAKVPNAKPTGHPYYYGYQSRHKRDDKPSEEEKPSNENTENEVENEPESSGTTPSHNPTLPGACKGEGNVPENGSRRAISSFQPTFQEKHKLLHSNSIPRE